MQRYAGGQVKTAHAYLRGLLKRISREMVDASTDFQRGRFLVLSKYIEQIIREESQSYTIQLTKELDDFAQYESDFSFRLLGVR